MLPCDSSARPSLNNFLASAETGVSSTGGSASSAKAGKTEVDAVVAAATTPAATS